MVLARRAIVEVPAAARALATLMTITRFKRLPEPIVIGGADTLGLLRWRAR